MNEPLLQADGLVRHYQIRRGSRLFSQAATLRAVDGVSFALQPGRTLGLVGESGCGKTTTARLVLGLLPLTAGEIRLQGETLPQAGIDALARAAPRHADGLPGSAGGARPSHRRRPAGHGAAGDPRHRRARRAARQGAGDPAVGRAAGAPLRPLSPRALGRPAPEDRARPRADPVAAAAGLRRADLGARRVDPGAGRQSPARPAGANGAGLSLHQPRSAHGPPGEPRSGGDVSRPDRRTRRSRPVVRGAGASLHAGAGVGDSGGASQRPATADPERRSAQPGRCADGLCLPRALPDCRRALPRGNAGACVPWRMGGTSPATLYLDPQMLESCRTAGLQARIFVFAGSAPLQWRIFVDHAAHERHWSGALPAKTPR